MIQLTRLNGHKIALNCHLIRFAESSPDTLITLVTGEKLLVQESSEQVAQLTQQHRAELLRLAWPTAASAFAAQASFTATSHPAGDL